MTSNARFYIRVRSEETNYNRKKDSKKKRSACRLNQKITVYADEDIHGTQTVLHNVQELRQKSIKKRYCATAS
jgi:hypothetical protein